VVHRGARRSRPVPSRQQLSFRRAGRTLRLKAAGDQDPELAVETGGRGVRRPAVAGGLAIAVAAAGFSTTPGTGYSFLRSFTDPHSSRR
jgi:hypothetical protein